jgi:hypothetical protein
MLEIAMTYYHLIIQGTVLMDNELGASLSKEDLTMGMVAKENFTCSIFAHVN